MKEAIGLTCNVYFNLNKNLWSIQHKGKVLGHFKRVTIRPLKFHVNVNGQQKVMADKSRFVHAWIRGVIIDFKTKNKGELEVSYNPYKRPYFYSNINKKYTSVDRKLYFCHESRKVHPLDEF